MGVLIFFLSLFLSMRFALFQLTPPELYLVNLSSLNLSSTVIAQANATIYSGYTALSAGASGTPPKRQINFFYVQAQGNNSNVAIIPCGGLGPGYSSLEVLFNEFGPFIFTEDIQSDSELRYPPYGLQLNPYALSYQSNLLFIDAIPTVGASYWSGSTQGSPINNNDGQQASDVYSVIADIVTSTGYTYLQNATFHIIGNGYAQQLAPLVAQAFANDQTLKLKLAGIFIGNPIFQNYPYSLVDVSQRWINMMNFLNNHNIIGDAEYNALSVFLLFNNQQKQFCVTNSQDPVCQWGQQTLKKQTQNLNPQGLFYYIFRYCYSDNLVPVMYNCTANYGLNYLLSDSLVQQALHFMQIVPYTNIFNYNILSNYQYDFTNNSIQALSNLINQNKYKIWYYSGDASVYMSQVDTIYYLEAVLGLFITQESTLFSISIPTPIGNQVGGFQTAYNNGVNFATLKKSGFLAGKWEGQELSRLFSLYLAQAQPSN